MLTLLFKLTFSFFIQCSLFTLHSNSWRNLGRFTVNPLSHEMQSKWTQISYWRDKQAAMAAIISLATYFYNSLLTGGNNNGPVIQLSPTGALRGVYETSRDGRKFASFYNVPFAKPPINQLRFEPPLPADDWIGIRDSSYPGPECLQIEVFAITYSSFHIPPFSNLTFSLKKDGSNAMVTGRVDLSSKEDCLTLNIHTPKYALDSKILLPVMVFIHGGLFISGGAKMYGAKYFMDTGNVLLITVQYRLGALGFLNTGDSLVRGNMGLKDQKLALQFIQEHVHKFGGNKNLVTIFGNSAGGSSVHFHILSPKSKGLFHKAISESGTALQIWTLSKHPKAQAKKFATQLKCPTQTSTEMVDCLKKLNPHELVKIHLATMSPIRDNTDLFVPTVDGEFIPDDPISLLANGSFNKVPWLTGGNEGEGLLNTGRILADENFYKHFLSKWNTWMPLMLDYDKNRIEVSQKIKDYYFGQVKEMNFEEKIRNITSVYSDRVYFSATQKAARYHAKFAPVFMYHFTYSGDFTFFTFFKAVMPRNEDLIAPEIKIAVDVAKDLFKKYLMRSSLLSDNAIPCHADELMLLFNMHRATEITRRSRDYKMSQQLVKTWTDFAKLENNSEFSYQDVPWSPINATSSSIKYMVLDNHARIINDPFENIISFWDSLRIS